MLEMNLPFRDAAHKSFFEAVIAELGDVDDHTKMAVNLLSATQETRDYFYDIYDVSHQEIRPGCWEEPWNTPMSKLVIAAALSLTGYLEATQPSCHPCCMPLTGLSGRRWWGRGIPVNGLKQKKDHPGG